MLSEVLPHMLTVRREEEENFWGELEEVVERVFPGRRERWLEETSVGSR